MQSTAAQTPSEDLSIKDLQIGEELVVNKPFGGLVDRPNFNTGDVARVVRIEPEEKRIVVADSEGNESYITDTQIDMGCVSQQ